MAILAPGHCKRSIVLKSCKNCNLNLDFESKVNEKRNVANNWYADWLKFMKTCHVIQIRDNVYGGRADAMETKRRIENDSVHGVQTRSFWVWFSTGFCRELPWISRNEIQYGHIKKAYIPVYRFNFHNFELTWILDDNGLEEHVAEAMASFVYAGGGVSDDSVGVNQWWNCQLNCKVNSANL